MFHHYDLDGRHLVSALAALPFPAAPERWDGELVWLYPRETPGRTAFRPSDPRQVTAEAESVAFLDPARLPDADVPPELAQAVAEGRITAVNGLDENWRRALDFPRAEKKRRRLHVLAVGDVGGTLLTALKLMGGDCLHTIGICDVNPAAVARYTAEMSQVSWPDDYHALPEVVGVEPEHLFACDVFLFAASRSIPAVGSDVKDVRMAQFDANRAIVEQYARQAREAGFRGLFLVMSDPVDPLCKAAWLASNTDEDGQFDGSGLLAEQIHGLGLGVMNARAAALAKANPAYAAFLTEGRSFGPHGQGLVIADSVEHYNDEISCALTQEVVEANLRIRKIGFKPYIAPALSSGALQILLLLRGEWHCGSVCLGSVWFGCRSRYTPLGLETEALTLPDALFDRLQETERQLAAII